MEFIETSVDDEASGPRFGANEQGATAIEYALVAAGVAAVITSTVFGFRADLKTTFYDRIAALL